MDISPQGGGSDFFSPGGVFLKKIPPGGRVRGEFERVGVFSPRKIWGLFGFLRRGVLGALFKEFCWKPRFPGGFLVGLGLDHRKLGLRWGWAAPLGFGWEYVGSWG